jgi:exodeoxyribonuclease III
MHMLALLLNIRHGGGPKAQALLDWVTSHSPDVVVMPEWQRNDAGDLIVKGLKAIGFRVATAVRSAPRCNGVLVGTKLGLETRQITPMGSEKGELLLAEIEHEWKLLAAYFPQGNAKEPFFKTCIAEARLNEAPFLLIGDLNTGNNDVDVEGKGVPFSCAKLFDALQSEARLFDLWRMAHASGREWSWRSPKNGFRADHAFANAAFLSRFRPVNCYYDHASRELRLTDHSALIVHCS